jgi:hypothetical protein
MTSPFSDWIVSLVDQTASIKSLSPCLGEAHIRVDADGKKLFFAGRPILQTPVTGAVRAYQQKETTAIEQLIGLVGGGFGASDLRVR